MFTGSRAVQPRQCVRLIDPARFRQVRQEGRSWVHPLLVLCALPNERPYSRFGISASRWVGKAVVRNRAKRRLREAIRGLWGGVSPGWDLVFVVRPSLRQRRFEHIVAAVRGVLQQAGLLLRMRTEVEEEAGHR